MEGKVYLTMWNRWMYNMSLIGILGMMLWTTAQANNRDSLALIEIYQATNGPNWNETWDLDDPIDEWFGVTLNAQGEVIGLDLSNNNLIGTLPEEMGFLAQLRLLRLPFNQITGSLPQSIGILIHLEEITLFNNQLNLPLIDTIGNLKKLRRLSLSNNQIPGGIPDSWGSIDSLRQLLLDRNQIEGVIPSTIGQLTHLELLALNDNLITGPLPDQLGQLGRLRELMIYENKISGSLPTSMTQMDSLEFLWFYDNQISGTLPAFTTNQLKSIRGENNSLTGLPDLTHLNLGPGFPEGISIEQNQLSFDDILINLGLNAFSRFSYRPQDTIGVFQTYYASEGDRLQIKLPFDDTVTTSAYRWYKDGDLNQLTTVNALIINNVDKSDEGIYYSEVRNNVIADLVLTSHPFRVVIRDSLSCDDPLAGPTCFNAPTFCQPDQLDLYCGSLPTALDTMGCQDIALAGETRWLSWVADTSYLELEVLPYSCSDLNAGIQWELYENCSQKRLIHCQDSCSQVENGITFDQLNQGGQYFLALRSCGGSCKYQLRMNSGGRRSGLLLEWPIDAPDTICQLNQNTLITLPNPPSSIETFVWTINDDTLQTNRPDLVYKTTQEGPVQVCVYGISPCDTSNQLCKTIEVFQGLTIKDLAIEVVRNDSFYVVKFKIEGGRGTIVIDSLGGKYNPPTNEFTSDLIRCGKAFQVVVFDETGCSDEASGVEVCNCSSEAGRISDQLREACENGTVRVGPASLSQLDSNDQAMYVICDQQTYDRNAIILTKKNGFFNYDPVLELDRVYYGFHLVGNELNGEVDVSDPCLSVAGPQPVIFYANPIAEAGEDDQYCQNSFTLRARKSRGSSEGFWRLISGQGGVVFSDDQNPVTNIRVVQSGLYEFEWTEVLNNCSDTDTVKIRVLPELEGQLIGPDSLCNGQTATLSLDREFDSYDWSTGDTTRNITINEPGQYCVDIKKDSICSRRICILVKDAIVMQPEIIGNTQLCDGKPNPLQVVPNYDKYEWSTGDSVFFIMVDTPGLYCITVTDFGGCQSTDCVVVNENDNRRTVIVDTLCFGDTLTIFDQQVFLTGEYNFRKDDGQACDTVVDVDLTVLDEIYISDSLINRDDGSGNGSISVNIRGGRPPYDYQWNTGATIPFIVNLVEGIYTLVVTDANRCTQMFTFDLREPNSTSDWGTDLLTVYPNPVSQGDYLTVASNLPLKDAVLHYDWVDLQGQRIGQGQIHLHPGRKSGFIPISDLPEGVYLLYISDENGDWSQVIRIDIL